MMNLQRNIVAALASLLLLAAVPRHVQTGDYFAGYAGTKVVPAQTAARFLSWAETDQPGSNTLASLGVKPILYSNPNIEMPGDPMYQADESAFFHSCNGQRIRLNDKRGFDVMDPHSTARFNAWKQYIDQRTDGARFAAVFEDEAVFPSVYGVGEPCGYDSRRWLDDMISAQRAIGVPIIYNGLSDFYNQGVAREIALNATAIGGMMEQCYSVSPPQRLAAGWKWRATENTELQMARDNKYFFCYGNDTSPADESVAQRLFVYASFVMTYDPQSSVLMDLYKTASGFHVMPETQLVPLDPVQPRVDSIDSLHDAAGAYVREYRDCYLAGRSEGPCAVAVNPNSDSTAALSLSHYHRILRLQGTDAYDGGQVSIVQQRVPAFLSPLSAVVALK